MKLAVKLNSAWRRELPPGDRRIWLLRAIALRLERGAKLSCTCEILWKRLLAGGAAVLILVYVLGVTALFFWWDRAPGNQVTWLDVATAPVRQEHVRQKRGDSAIAAALVRLREKDAVEAYYGLRSGLARSPANATGRVVLARLLLGSDPAAALTLLEDGLKHSPNDLELLRTLFGVYAAQRARTRSLATADRLLAGTPTPAARDWLADTRASLVLATRDNAAIAALLPTLPSPAAPAERNRMLRLRASALAQLGRFDEARQTLAALPGASLDDYRAEAELAIAAGDAGALESVLKRMKAASPGQPAASVFAFAAWHRMKRLSLRDLEEAEFFQFFGQSDAALQVFAASAVNLDLPDAVRRTEQIALASRLSPFAFRVHLTELALRHGDVDEAFRRLREWEPTIETLAPPQRFYPEFINRLTRASVAGGEQQSGSLVNMLGDLRGRASVAMFELAAKVLARAGNFSGARDVVTLGRRRFPHSDPLAQLEPELTAAAQKQAVAQSSATAVANVAPPTVAVPPSAARALEELDAALAAEAFGTVGDLLRAIRAARPAWLDKAVSDLARRDAELAVLSQEPAAARTLLRGYLEYPRPEGDLLALVQLADRLRQRGRAAEARLVRDELAAAHPPTAVSAALVSLELPDDLAALASSPTVALVEIDRALRQNRADDALRVLDYVRQKAPPWLADARAELGASEVRVRLALDQRPRALVALKEIVIRAGASRSTAFKLVRQLLADGQPEAALLLAREIARLLPDDKAAATLLREAEAPTPAGN
ncbi:MAG: hypothetical protein HYV96_05365 [Opitutae bacterium]|nr:hypothetical protein [Opitutae bacterium]